MSAPATLSQCQFTRSSGLHLDEDPIWRSGARHWTGPQSPSSRSRMGKAGSPLWLQRHDPSHPKVFFDQPMDDLRSALGSPEPECQTAEEAEIGAGPIPKSITVTYYGIAAGELGALSKKQPLAQRPASSRPAPSNGGRFHNVNAFSTGSKPTTGVNGKAVTATRAETVYKLSADVIQEDRSDTVKGASNGPEGVDVRSIVEDSRGQMKIAWDLFSAKPLYSSATLARHRSPKEVTQPCKRWMVAPLPAAKPQGYGMPSTQGRKLSAGGFSGWKLSKRTPDCLRQNRPGTANSPGSRSSDSPLPRSRPNTAPDALPWSRSSHPPAADPCTHERGPAVLRSYDSSVTRGQLQQPRSPPHHSLKNKMPAPPSSELALQEPSASGQHDAMRAPPLNLVSASPPPPKAVPGSASPRVSRTEPNTSFRQKVSSSPVTELQPTHVARLSVRSRKAADWESRGYGEGRPSEEDAAPQDQTRLDSAIDTHNEDAPQSLSWEGLSSVDTAPVPLASNLNPDDVEGDRDACVLPTEVAPVSVGATRTEEASATEDGGPSEGPTDEGLSEECDPDHSIVGGNSTENSVEVDLEDENSLVRRPSSRFQSPRCMGSKPSTPRKVGNAGDTEKSNPAVFFVTEGTDH